MQSWVDVFFESLHICCSIWCLSQISSFLRWLLRCFVTSVPHFFRSLSASLRMFVIFIISHSECQPPAIKPRALFRLSRDHLCFFIMSANPQIKDVFMFINFIVILAKNILRRNLRMANCSGTFDCICNFRLLKLFICNCV